MSQRWVTRCMVFSLLFAGASAAHAADEIGKWYFNPQGGYLWTDNDRFVDDDGYYGLGFGNHVSREWSVEVNGVTGKYDPTAGGESVDITAFSIDALRVFRRAERVSPFVIVGAGYIDDELAGDGKHGNALGQLGVGLLIDLVENSSHTFVLQLRPEAKARWDFISRNGNDGFLDYAAGLGIQFAFGSARAAAAPAAAMSRVEIIDSIEY